MQLMVTSSMFFQKIPSENQSYSLSCNKPLSIQTTSADVFLSPFSTELGIRPPLFRHELAIWNELQMYV